LGDSRHRARRPQGPRERYKSPADLKGMKIGVSAPGSSTNFFVMYLLAKAGLKPTDASYIGVGIGPSVIAAVLKGEIDAMSNLDPMMTKLELDGQIKVVADSRTEEGPVRSSVAPTRRRCSMPSRTSSHAIPTPRSAGQRLLQDAQMAGERDTRAGDRHRAGRVLAGRPGALHRRGQGQQTGLFTDGIIPAPG